MIYILEIVISQRAICTFREHNLSTDKNGTISYLKDGLFLKAVNVRGLETPEQIQKQQLFLLQTGTELIHENQR
ncbi:hypothetical protein BpHYR1_031549 [Brachionus plicatilis]|uniref:Uncharacterized protein n=1 Tax=Brachionus plicatilis TaxID=10195 RepID=A0A3M7QA21_BRAPC|nr:hypothetical protein BpHYR1_031549 [Brachionus plicatilis]